MWTITFRTVDNYKGDNIRFKGKPEERTLTINHVNGFASMALVAEDKRIEMNEAEGYDRWKIVEVKHK